eukprot:jgi/Ulvmu1/12422/UM009_0072.1
MRVGGGKWRWASACASRRQQSWPGFKLMHRRQQQGALVSADCAMPCQAMVRRAGLVQQALAAVASDAPTDGPFGEIAVDFDETAIAERQCGVAGTYSVLVIPVPARAGFAFYVGTGRMHELRAHVSAPRAGVLFNAYHPSCGHGELVVSAAEGFARGLTPLRTLVWMPDGACALTTDVTCAFHRTCAAKAILQSIEV